MGSLFLAMTGAETPPIARIPCMTACSSCQPWYKPTHTHSSNEGADRHLQPPAFLFAPQGDSAEHARNVAPIFGSRSVFFAESVSPFPAAPLSRRAVLTKFLPCCQGRQVPGICRKMADNAAGCLERSTAETGLPDFSSISSGVMTPPLLRCVTCERLHVFFLASSCNQKP